MMTIIQIHKRMDLESDELENNSNNEGTLTLAVTCASLNIRYPQEFSLLNEVREKLETIILSAFKSYMYFPDHGYSGDRPERIILHLLEQKTQYQENQGGHPKTVILHQSRYPL